MTVLLWIYSECVVHSPVVSWNKCTHLNIMCECKRAYRCVFQATAVVSIKAFCKMYFRVTSVLSGHVTPLPLMQIPVRWLVAPPLSAPGWRGSSHAFFSPGRERCPSRNKHIRWWRKDKEVLCLYTAEFHLRKSGTGCLQGGAGRSLGPVRQGQPVRLIAYEQHLWDIQGNLDVFGVLLLKEDEKS